MLILLCLCITYPKVESYHQRHRHSWLNIWCPPTTKTSLLVSRLPLLRHLPSATLHHRVPQCHLLFEVSILLISIVIHSSWISVQMKLQGNLLVELMEEVKWYPILLNHNAYLDSPLISTIKYIILLTLVALIESSKNKE